MKGGKTEVSRVMPGGGIESKLNEAIRSLREIENRDDVAFLWTGGKEAQVIMDILLYNIRGDNERVPFDVVTLDTGNAYDEMYEFREEFISPGGDGPTTGVESHKVLRYDEMIDKVINNPADPRDYHGKMKESTCPECEDIMVKSRQYTFECQTCGNTYKVHNRFRDTLSESEWTIESSCGTLKTVPLRRLISEGYETIITGRRSDDPLIAGGDQEFGVNTRKRNPLPHHRVNPLANWEEAYVYAYIKRESVVLPSLYTDEGFRHTDSKCCTDEKQSTVGEYGEGGRDPQKIERRENLEDMGYI